MTEVSLHSAEAIMAYRPIDVAPTGEGAARRSRSPTTR